MFSLGDGNVVSFSIQLFKHRFARADLAESDFSLRETEASFGVFLFKLECRLSALLSALVVTPSDVDAVKVGKC